MIRITDADHASDVLMGAMGRRWRVTLGFWEVRTEEYEGPGGVKRKRKVRARNPETGRMEDTYVHTVRTVEFFDVDARQSDTDAVFFTGMDACPRDGGGPAIRRVRADRITDVTVHKRCPYRMPNAHFIGRVRAHAAEHSGEGWGEIAALTDDALWSLIEDAHSAEAAITIATEYAS